VPDLVAEMAQQRAVRLVQFVPDPLAFRVVGLLDIERDQSLGVAGHHAWPAGG
jgi:hypothetical protein